MGASILRRARELGVTWHIVPRGDTLILRRGPVPDITLQPVFGDAFNSPGGVVRFTRAANGGVTGLVIGAGRVTGFVFRSIERFMRMNQRSLTVGHRSN